MRIVLVAMALSGCTALSSYNVEGHTASGAASLERSSYIVTALGVQRVDDTDGDGQVDNQLVNALNAIDIVLPDDFMSLALFNERLIEVLEKPDNRIVLETAVEGDEMSVDVLPSSEQGSALVRNHDAGSSLDGEALGAGMFLVGPSDVSFRVIARDDLLPVDVPLVQTVMTGDHDGEGIDGELQGIIPLDPILDDVVDPLLWATGWDIDGDGVLETPEEVSAFIRELAPGLADTRLQDGSLGISATLSFSGDSL